MKMGRTILAIGLAALVAACGGGNSSGNGSGGIGNPSTSTCSISARQDWAKTQLDTYYLFPDLLATNVNKASYSTVQGYIDALVAPARAQRKDRYFTYLTSIKEEEDLIANGSNAGFGVRFAYDTGAARVFVLEAFENAPGYSAGIDRGTELTSINGTSVSSLMASGGAQAVSDALGPSEPGVTRTLGIRQPDGTTKSVSVTKTEYSLDPVSDRYGAKILNNGGTKVGYINLRTFIIANAASQLRTAFKQFKAQGVEQVILDVRYNGGGLVSVSEVLGDLMGQDLVGDVFSKTIYRASLSSNNRTELFDSEANGIAAMKIAVIGTHSTASASELIANAFIPWRGTNLALVGTDTYGKPVGQIAEDRAACDDRFRIIAFRTVNATGGGDYYDGLADVMPVTCSANDDFLTPLGDPTEDSIARALDFLAGRSCTAIAGTGGTGAQGVRSRKELIMPRQPTAAQLQIPGLF